MIRLRAAKDSLSSELIDVRNIEIPHEHLWDASVMLHANATPEGKAVVYAWHLVSEMHKALLAIESSVDYETLIPPNFDEIVEGVRNAMVRLVGSDN